LADVITQREYLEQENDVIVEATTIEPAEETTEVSGTVEEDGEVLENFPADRGFNDDDDDFERGFNDGFRWDTNEDGTKCLRND
jgi:hypothetical protein